MAHTATSLLNRLLARGKFRHVQVLLQLAELGSVHRTAEAVGMTQPSVTQTLAYLERLLEIQLFERHARGVRPTAACVDLLPLARQLMLGFAGSAQVVANRHQQGEGVVRVVASAAAIHGLLIDALPRFSDRHPAIHVPVVEAEGEDQLLAVARGEADLVVCRRPHVIPEHWQFEPLLDDRLVIVCREDHPLARRRRLTWLDAARATWLLLPVGVAVRQQFDEMTEHFPLPVRSYPVVTRSIPMLSRLLLQRPLLALVPMNLVRPLLDDRSLAELRIGPAIRIEPIGLLRPKAPLGVAAARLERFLSEDAAGSPVHL